MIDNCSETKSDPTQQTNPPSQIKVVSVNISEAKGTAKTPAPQIVLTSRGITGDAHAGRWHRQVSILSQEIIDRFAAEHNRPTTPGEFAENITVAGLDLDRVAPLDRFVVGPAELEVTQIGKECHGDQCSIFKQVGKCVMPTEGIFARVVHDGTVRSGDVVIHCPRTLRVHIITLSDRASAGEYADRSGPRAREIIEQFFDGSRWHLQTYCDVLPDSRAKLQTRLLQAQDAGADIIITTGSTGVGPRDIAPEAVSAVCDKFIPGIMEHIRVTCGASCPGALLSRSVAGVAGKSLIFALPGSVKAVQEYLAEIVKVLEHLIFTIHGIDSH